MVSSNQVAEHVRSVHAIISRPQRPSGHELVARSWLRCFHELGLDPAAEDDPLFKGLPLRFAAQATHLQSVLRAPDGATVLARSAHDACHAFRVGDRAWGVQFHPEFSATHMRGYVHARRDALRDEGTCPSTLARKVSATPHARRVLRRFVRHARALAR